PRGAGGGAARARDAGEAFRLAPRRRGPAARGGRRLPSWIRAHALARPARARLRRPPRPDPRRALMKMGGPDMAPPTPQPSERPGEAVALLHNSRRSEARQRRGAPLQQPAFGGPATPGRSSITAGVRRPGEAGALLYDSRRSEARQRRGAPLYSRRSEARPKPSRSWVALLRTLGGRGAHVRDQHERCAVGRGLVGGHFGAPAVAHVGDDEERDDHDDGHADADQEEDRSDLHGLGAGGRHHGEEQRHHQDERDHPVRSHALTVAPTQLATVTLTEPVPVAPVESRTPTVGVRAPLSPVVVDHGIETGPELVV